MSDAEVVERVAKALFAEEHCDSRQRLALDENWVSRTNDEDRAEYRALAKAALQASRPLPADYGSTWELTEEERSALPPEYHQPVWMDLSTPGYWMCSQCWGEGTSTTWPCEVAGREGKTVAKAGGLQVAE
jgi:hypothetical protein